MDLPAEAPLLYYELGGHDLLEHGYYIEKRQQLTSTVWVGQFQDGTTSLVQNLSVPILDDIQSKQQQAAEITENIIEMKRLRELNHPGLITICDFAFQSRDTLEVIIFESYSSPLDQMKRLGEICFSEDEAGIILKGILSTLCYLHSHRIGWLDLRAKNIFVNGEGQILANPISLHSITRHLTKESVPFISPEQIDAFLSEQPSHPWTLNASTSLLKSDVWSFGMAAIDLALEVRNINLIQNLVSAVQKTEDMNEFFHNAYAEKLLAHLPEGNWSPQFRDLVTCCLRPRVEERPTADELMRHPFFRMVGSPSLNHAALQPQVLSFERLFWVLRPKPEGFSIVLENHVDEPLDASVGSEDSHWSHSEVKHPDRESADVVDDVVPKDRNDDQDYLQESSDHPQYQQKHGTIVSSVSVAGPKAQIETPDKGDSPQLSTNYEHVAQQAKLAQESYSASLSSPRGVRDRGERELEVTKLEVPRPELSDDEDSYVEDPANLAPPSQPNQLLPIKVSIHDMHNTHLPVVINVGQKNDNFLVYLRSIAGTEVDIKLTPRQITIKGALPPLQLPEGVNFSGPLSGHFTSTVEFLHNIDVTRVSSKLSHQTLVITLPKAIQSCLGTQVF